MEKYNHQQIEPKWQQYWQAQEIYKTASTNDKPKYYILDMFPYPSGAGLHVGHPKGYIATDVFARLKMMQGFNVLHPIGWDAFGLPAENYALKNKVHPAIATQKNIDTYKRQLEILGFTYDWSREINTTDPEFYQWTQWAFIKMFERGLVYESYEPINWCPSCQTGLSNEDVENGNCERCGTLIEKKPMRQWMIKMTDYAERLLNDLDKLPDWEESIVEMQRNWIGKSEGAEIVFPVKSHNVHKVESQIKVFTTRPDTLFGCTYMVVAPENEIIKNYKLKITNWDEVQDYIGKAKNKSELERTDLNKNKTGVKLEGVMAVNPVNGKEVPIFVADYVLAGYGTGAIMAVPGHDERDWEFAKKYNIEILEVVSGGNIIKEAYVGDGILVNSEFLNGLTMQAAQEKMIAWLEESKLGQKRVHYKLRDWVFSRQRYWGEPIPLIFCENCQSKVKSGKSKVNNIGEQLNPGWFVDYNLPLTLPEVEHYEPSGTGESPLATISEWVNTTCPHCGGPAKRETNTMPQWAGSSWYYLRYIDAHNNKELVNKAQEKYWSPVDFYVGGAEHATRHLIYARFWHKFLFDIGVVNYDEPFKRLQHVGLILAEDGRKMSKRWGNVINPDEIVAGFGADAMRVFEMFMAPFSQPCAWSNNGVAGSRKFLDRVWGNKLKVHQVVKSVKSKVIANLLHKTIKKVGEDIEGFRFNTAVSAMMILLNEFDKEEKIDLADFEKFIILLSPFAPHVAEEIWQSFNEISSDQKYQQSIFKNSWPRFDAQLIVDEKIKLVFQINGKVRDMVEVDANINEEEAKALAMANSKVQKFLEGRPVKQIIFVPGKLVNIVA